MEVKKVGMGVRKGIDGTPHSGKHREEVVRGHRPTQHFLGTSSYVPSTTWAHRPSHYD